MTPPSTAEVVKMAKLARIRVDDAEVQRLTADVARVIDYLELLFAVDVASVEPMRQPTAEANGALSATQLPLRPDVAQAVLGTRAIAGSAGAADGLVRVPKVVG